MSDETSTGRLTRRSLLQAGAAAPLAAGARFVWNTDQPARLEGAPEGLRRLSYRSGVDGADDWALARPPARGDLWIVMIHGHGSRGDQLFTRPDIRDSWLPAFLGAGAGLLTPNLRGNAWMGPAAARDLRDLLAAVRERLGARRFLLASGSMGGTSNLIYAALRPEDVAGVVALGAATDLASYHSWLRQRNAGVIADIAAAIEAAYGGPPARASARYQAHSAVRHARRLQMPVWLCHGARDDLIPVEQTRRLAGAMATAPDFVYMEAPDGGHDAPLAMMPEAVRWALRRIEEAQR